jgi:Tfp pilus assembly PilM family ATPase/Tfp pilus assembly protein PilN
MASKRKQDQAWSGQPRDKALLLEVSADWIKLIEVTGSRRGGLTLSRAHLEPVDQETVVADSLTAALKKGFSRLPVLSCIPRQLVNVRLLELPSIEPAEIADMVELQIGRQTPYSVDEILSGYKDLGAIRQGTYTRVMLVIAQRSVVRERYYAAEGAGLSVERMTVSSEGILNWLLYRTQSEPPEKLIALLDVDSFFTHMIVIQHRRVVFTKSILLGATQLADGHDTFVRRVQEAVQACGEALRGERIESVLLSGAAVHLEGLDSAIGEALSVPCIVADCLDDLKVGKDCVDLHDARYATASLTSLVGMALAPDKLDFDFTPDVVRLRGQLVKNAKMWAAMAMLLVTAMVCGSLFAMLSVGYRLRTRDRLKQEAAAIASQADDVERMSEVIRATHKRQEARFLPERLLPIIHSSLPELVYIEQLTIDADKRQVTMSGTSPSRKDIRELVRLLEESPYFKEVEESGRTAMNRDERFTFQVTGSFEEDTRND